MAESSRAVREDFVFSHGEHNKVINPIEVKTSFAGFVAYVTKKHELHHGSLSYAKYHAASKAVQAVQKNGPYFVPAKFARPGRKAEDVLAVHAFVADLDKGGITKRDIEVALDGRCYLAYTTYSHQHLEADAVGSRWRVIIPYERPLTRADQHEGVFVHFQKLFAGAIDEASRRFAQIYYLPGCPRDAAKYRAVAFELAGVFFDPYVVEVVAPHPRNHERLIRGAINAEKLADIRSALEFVAIPKEDGTGRYHLWILVGMALHDACGGSEEGLRLWCEWHLANAYDRDVAECDEKWPTFGKHAPGSSRVTIASLFDRAIKAGWRKLPVGTDDALEDFPVEFSQDHIAEEFAARHGEDLRYVHAWGKWLRWEGVRWVEEKTLYTLDLARKLCREKAQEVRGRVDLTVSRRERIAAALSQAPTVVSVLTLARADRRLAMRSEDWDNDRYVLNTPGGTVDLRTGKLRAAAPGDYITKMTAVAPSGRCPTWDKFLRRVMNDDNDLIAFLQRLIGYSLTGDVSEHALVFFYGTGGNGKSTFLNTITALMGDYAVVAPSETFVEGRGDRHPTELAMLRGARLVVASEVEEGRRWAENRVKSLTGGEPITARHMRQDFFTFDPQFTLIVAGNHKPGLRNVDEAIRRRMYLVPWLVTISEDERDTELLEKLRAEGPGILAWAIEGCLAWQHEGLNPPRAVKVATNEYLQDEDQIAHWIAECCEVQAGLKEPRSFVYASYKRWCEETGEKLVMSARRLYDRLETLGYGLRVVEGTRYIDGMKTKFDTGPHLRAAPVSLVKKQ